MRLPVIHSELGPGVLTTEHSASSYGWPVFVPSEDNPKHSAYSPTDAPGILRPVPEHPYTDEENEYIKRITRPGDGVNWTLGSGGAQFGSGRNRYYVDTPMVTISGKVHPDLKAWVEANGGLRTVLEKARGADLENIQ